MPFERIPSGTPRSHAFGRTLLAMGLRRRSSRATTASITATTAVKAVARDTPAEFTCFLIKVASRCNLACDYCYMYEHADQSWRDQPRVISDETVQALASRIAEYVSVARLERVLVVLHGGEPLLVGADRLAGIAAQIRAAVPTETLVDVSIQTNGLLLDSVSLARLASEEISVSLSIDGPRHAQDRHRLTIRGRSSFDRTLEALELLQENQASFAGVIAVVDPEVPAADLFKFFSGYQIPQLDFLLPDANHDRPPPGRERDPDLYVRWMIDAFDLWFDAYSDLPVRTFDSLLGAVAGLSSGTDAFGLGDVSLLTVETDGTYHDLDVLKITAPGQTKIGMNVRDDAIASAACSPVIAAHQSLLEPTGLADECRRCPELMTCGGGAVPHRFGEGSFEHPTVYCREMLALLAHARDRLSDALGESVSPRPQLAASLDLAEFELAETASEPLAELLSAWSDKAEQDLDDCLAAAADAGEVADLGDISSTDYRRLAVHPSVVLWAHLQQSPTPIRTLDARRLGFDPTYVRFLPELRRPVGSTPSVHRSDPLLRGPFGPPITFDAEEIAEQERHVAQQSLALIGDWRPELLSELNLLCTDIQFVRDASAADDKCVSFSDDIVPGAIFVTAHTSTGLLDPYNLADSIIHEYRHQKLYLLDRLVPLVEDDAARVKSPWRDDPRPPSGLLHACFVFVELTAFWLFVEKHGLAASRSQATNQIAANRENLAAGFATLREAPLTGSGRELAEVLERRFDRECN